MAENIGSFIAARAFCGLGGGGILALGMIIISDVVRIEYRGVYQSYSNLCLGAGSSLGLVLGGFLCDKVGWRGAFLVQLPFILGYFLLAVWTMPSDLGMKEPSKRMTPGQLVRSIDITGSVILVGAVTALIMGLNLGGNFFSWGHPVVVTSLAMFCVLSVVFVAYERKVELAVMPLELLSTNPRASLIFGNFFGAISINSVVFNAPLFFQAVKLASPTESGLRLIGPSLAITFSSVLTGFLITWTRRCKPTMLIGGLCLLVGGLSAAIFINVDTSDAIAMLCLAISSLGQGFAFPALTVAVLATSEQDEQAVATTTLGLWRNLGSVMGVATSSWIFQNTLLYKLKEMVTGSDKEAIIFIVRKSVQSIAGLDPVHRQQGRWSFIMSFLFFFFGAKLTSLVTGAYMSALSVTFFSAAIWAGIMLLMHVGVRVPRLGQR